MRRYSRGPKGTVIKAAAYLLAVTTGCVWDKAPRYVDLLLGIGLILLVLIGPFPRARFPWSARIDELP